MRTLRTSLLLGVAWPFAALAQDFDIGAVPAPPPPAPILTSQVETGFGYQSPDSFFFGRYGGRTKKGAFVFGDADISRRPAWDSGDGRFFDAHVIFNGQDLPSVAARYGVQGHWRVNASFDSFTMYDTNTAKTPFDGIGSSKLTLPANWLGTASSLLFPSLQADLEDPLELKVRWQTVGGDYVLTPKPGYEARIHFDHRDRDGLKYGSLPFGPESLFPVGIFFPQPVDYHSNHVTVSLGYAEGPLQWKAAYSLSTFHNDVPSVFVPNPYSRSLGLPWIAGAFAGYPYAIGQYSLPPDNVAHQAALTGGYAITPQLRLTAKLSYAIQTQNEPFLPYTDNVNLAVNTPLPRTSLNGDVRKTFANVTLTGRQKTFDFTASYTFDDRDNRTPVSLYSYIPNDSQDQVLASVNGVSRFIRYNLPHSFTFQQARVEAGYRFTPRTRLSLSYNGDFRTRTYQEVARTNEHTVRAKVQTTFERGSAWIGYTFGVRHGSDYLDYAAWNASHTANYLAAGPQDQSIEYPLLRKYNLADRRHQEFKSGASVDLSRSLTASFSAGYAKDAYMHSLYGLLATDSLLGDADISYVIKDRLTLSAFYTFERMRSRQAGYFLFTASLTNPAQAWSAGNRDLIHSAGAKLDWIAQPNKLKFGASYTLSDGTTHIDVADTAFTPLAAVAPMPDATALTHNVGLNAEYTMRDGMSFRIGYTFEHHVTDDWRYLSSLTPVAQILGSGELAPRYNAHVVWISTRKRF